ncbi:prolipoprotein diacylglyceryl transferase [Candidatus Woesearchaeota archaeon]|nr:prolipoprotein diacylglyceryl transferase [Candidatus Woesearchaeota archaeon]
MFIHNINPILLSIFGLEIRYYGLVYAIGFIFSLWYVLKLVEKKEINLTKDEVYDFMIWIIIGLVIGGRLGIILFYNLGYYLANPFEIIAIWHGGMSFHGAIIGMILVGYYFHRKKKIDFYQMADAIVVPAALMLMFGRVANFINGELYGTITNVSWGVKFPDVEGFRHPSQLYEAFKNLVIFSTLWFLKSKKHKKGFLFWCFVTMYGLLRTLISFYRVPTTMIFGVSVGQLFSFGMFVVGAYVLFNHYKRKR